MPLYTLWEEGTANEIFFAIVHCTGGDLLIAMSALLGSLFLLDKDTWPKEPAISVYVVALLIGIVYTVFSEWLNVEVRQSWAYTEVMPVLPWIGTGMTPILQWIVVPTAAYYFAMTSWRRG